MGFMEDHLSTKLENCSELFIVVITRNDVSKTNVMILVIKNRCSVFLIDPGVLYVNNC